MYQATYKSRLTFVEKSPVT